jgi:hypothetical protein
VFQERSTPVLCEAQRVGGNTNTKVEKRFKFVCWCVVVKLKILTFEHQQRRKKQSLQKHSQLI